MFSGVQVKFVSAVNVILRTHVSGKCWHAVNKPTIKGRSHEFFASILTIRQIDNEGRFSTFVSEHAIRNID